MDAPPPLVLAIAVRVAVGVVVVAVVGVAVPAVGVPVDAGMMPVKLQLGSTSGILVRNAMAIRPRVTKPEMTTVMAMMAGAGKRPSMASVVHHPKGFWSRRLSESVEDTLNACEVKGPSAA